MTLSTDDAYRHQLGGSFPGLTNEPDDIRLLTHVRPHAWANPKAEGRYNLVVIGAGTAGLVSAMGAAGLGGKVALIERALLGGDCLNFGCVPSKALLHAASEFQARGRPDFPAAMQQMRRVRADISVHDAAARFRDAGVDVFLGEARFTGPDTVEVGGQTLEFARAILATGSRAALPPIPGLEAAPHHTNETIFGLTSLPRRLAVIGGGPIGCELAQAFRRFGATVRLFDHGPRLLGKDDPDAAAVVTRRLEREGVELQLGAKLLRCEPSANGFDLVYEVGAGEDAEAASGLADGAQGIAPERASATERRFTFDAVLVAAGRRPNVEGVDLERAGIAFDRRGVTVDKRLRTSNKRVYAAGDCCSRFQFTHAADAMARIALQNALFFGRKSVEDLVIPWATYTEPELAHVGLDHTELAKRRDQGMEITTVTVELGRVDRALCEQDTEGFGRFHIDRKGRILAATLVGAHAGELISEVTLAMSQRLSMGKLANTIHPYPTRSEVIKRAADEYNRKRLTPFVARILRTILKWRR